MPKAAKPTVEEIKALYQRCEIIYSPLRSQFEDDEKFYELDFKDDLLMPVEFANEGIVLPTCRDMVDACVDHTDVTNARIFVNRKGTSAVSEEEAEMLRKFYLGLIHRTNVEASISPWRISGKHYWMHGLAVLKTVWDADRWVDKPTRNKSESEDAYAARIDEWRSEHTQSLPIVIQAVNPHNMMPDPYEGGGLFVFETQEKLVMDVSRRYPKWSNPQTKSADKTVSVVSFWTPQYRCELYDGEPVLPVQGGVATHSYGFIPYVFIDTGLGNMDYKADPKARYVGILRYIRDLVVSESRNYSITDVVLKRTAYPWGTIEGKGAETITKIDQSFGSFTPLPEGVKIVPQSPQVPPQALQQHLAITSSYITAHAAPNSIRGMGETGVRSGVDRRQLIAEASTRYQYSNEAFRNGTAKVLANCARLLKNVIPGDVRVWARTPNDEFDIEIKKDKLKEPFTCYVEFAPVSEEDEYRRHDDLERLVASGIVTRRWARTQMSNVNPADLELQEEVDRLKADPAVQQIISQYIAGKMTEAVVKRSAAESAKSPPPPVPEAAPEAPPAMMPMEPPPMGAPRQMQPPIPNVPQPGTAQALQNELRGRRSTVPIFPNQGAGGGGNR